MGYQDQEEKKTSKFLAKKDVKKKKKERKKPMHSILSFKFSFLIPFSNVTFVP